MPDIVREVGWGEKQNLPAENDWQIGESPF